MLALIEAALSAFTDADVLAAKVFLSSAEVRAECFKS